MLFNPYFEREGNVFVILFRFPNLLIFLIFSKCSPKCLEKKVILFMKALKQISSVEFFILVFCHFQNHFCFACRFFFVQNRDVSSFFLPFCAFYSLPFFGFSLDQLITGKHFCQLLEM